MDVSRRGLLYGLGGAVGVGSVGAATTDTLGTAGGRSPTALVAGSLLHVAEQIPGAAVEARGSGAVRQMVRNDLRDPDAVALADPRLFAGISPRATLFATNALVVTYDPDSEHAGAIRRDWTTALGRDGLRLGRTDPEVDPLGYRTVMALRLAETEFDLDAGRVLAGATVLRETDLLNVVETGRVDAAVTYRNMAVERGLPYVSLPDRLDFSSPAHAETYGTVAYDLGEQRLRGAPIRYAATDLTPAGREWVDALVTATETLDDHGFSLPSGYPRRDVALDAEGGR